MTLVDDSAVVAVAVWRLQRAALRGGVERAGACDGCHTATGGAALAAALHFVRGHPRDWLLTPNCSVGAVLACLFIVVLCTRFGGAGRHLGVPAILVMGEAVLAAVL